MKLIINDTVELEAEADLITERKINNGNTNDYKLIININNCTISNDELETSFSGIEEIKVIRTDLENKESVTVFTKYNILNKIERKVTDESDITTITLAASDNTSTAE